MLIELSEAELHKGKVYNYQVSFEGKVVNYSGDIYKVTSSKPFDLSVCFNKEGRLLLTFNTSFKFESSCYRCLEPVETVLDIDFTDEIDTSDKESCLFIEDGKLNTEELLLNEIIIGLPMKTLCSESCKGICGKCGMNLNHSTCNCETKELDPRMAKFLEFIPPEA